MPSLTIDIARRYLFSKKYSNSINIITGISILGIGIGTSALILILSVFNGFEGLLTGLFNAFNPDIKIESKEGKFFEVSDEDMLELSSLPGVESISKTIEEVALFEYKGVQEIGMIKGVDDSYLKVTRLDTLLVDGKYKTKEGKTHFAMLGIGMKNKLSINVSDRITPMTVYMPAKKKSLLGSKDFITRNLYPVGVFSVRSESDYQFILTSYDLAANLLDKRGRASYLEVKKNQSISDNELKESLSKVLGTKLVYKNRYEQDETTLKVMQIEKWITFLIAGLTMLLIAFNLLGALWMIGLEKRKDISVLKALGFADYQVRRLFMQLGTLITLIGIFFGFIIALFLYFIQKKFGIIGVPASFLMDAYPIQLRGSDFIIVSVTVLLIGSLAALLPAIKASNNTLVLRSK